MKLKDERGNSRFLVWQNSKLEEQRGLRATDVISARLIFRDLIKKRSGGVFHKLSTGYLPVNVIVAT